MLFVKPISCICVYRPPGSKVALFENTEALFSILDHEHFEFLALGISTVMKFVTLIMTRNMY